MATQNTQDLERDQAIGAKALELKKKHGEITVIKVLDKVAYFKQANRQTVGYAMTLMSSSMDAAYESILNNCYLEGDREIIDEDKYFLIAMPEANKLIASGTAEVLKF